MMNAIKENRIRREKLNGSFWAKQEGLNKAERERIRREKFRSFIGEIVKRDR